MENMPKTGDEAGVPNGKVKGNIKKGIRRSERTKNDDSTPYEVEHEPKNGEGEARNIDPPQIEEKCTTATDDSVQDLFEEIEEVLEKNEKMSEGSFQKAFFRVFRLMYGKLQDENSSLKDEVAQLKKRIQCLEEEKLHKDCEESKRGILVWNLPIILDENQTIETNESLRSYVSSVAISAKISSDGISTVRRLPASRMAIKRAQETKTEVKRPVLVRFHTAGQKFLFLKGLLNARTKGERYSQEYPFHLRETAIMLESVAFAVRRARNGTKTRITWIGNNLVLMAKGKNDSKFTELQESDWPEQK